MAVFANYISFVNLVIIVSQSTANKLNTDTTVIEDCLFNFCGALATIKKLKDKVICIFQTSLCEFGNIRDGIKDMLSGFIPLEESSTTNNTKSDNITELNNSSYITPNATIGRIYSGNVFSKGNKISLKFNNNSVKDFKSYINVGLSNNKKNYKRRVDSRWNTKNNDLRLHSLVSDLANYHGYRMEVHTVTTPDGYILTLHRIVPFENGKNKRKIAIMHHGLLGCSMDWILLGANKSLAYLLFNVGYDVWLTNARGNKYSRNHVTNSVHSTEFWDFSWHEIGLYDLSATIDYIKDQSLTSSQIVFVAHSMGATALMVLLSTSPRYNSYINLAVLLAPLIFMQQAKGPLRLLSEFRNLDFNSTVNFLGINEFNPKEAFIKFAAQKFCKRTKTLCDNPLFLLTEGGRIILNSELHKNILAHVPSGGSTKTITHYEQLIHSGRFEMFDGGSAMNLKKYGTASPPNYHLEYVKLPILLFSSHDDWLSTVPDIINLLWHIRSSVKHHLVQKSSNEFSHFDFLWDEDAPLLVYRKILDVLDQY